MKIFDELKLTKQERLDHAFAEVQMAAEYGYEDPVRRRGKVVFGYAWKVRFPTKREAKLAARKLRQAGYGRKPRCRSADKNGEFFMSRTRRRQQAQRQAAQVKLWELFGPPF